MAVSDGDFISKEKHELDYVLRKWNKRTNQANRDLLAQALDKFRDDPEQKPYTRELFYMYAEKKGLKHALESQAGTIVSEGLSVSPSEKEKPRFRFRIWWLFLLLVLVLVIFLLFRACGGRASAASSSTAETVPQISAAPAQIEQAPTETILTLESLPRDFLVLRFLPNAETDLAPGEESKLKSLIASLKALSPDKGELVLVGHAADIGFPQGEQRISEGRALYIARRLGEAGLKPGVLVSTEGRGARFMLSGEDKGKAAAASRRVEISVR